MLWMKKATVVELVSATEQKQVLWVEEEDGARHKAINYLHWLPPLEAGDSVLVNTTAIGLELGTGGFHFVHTLLQRKGKEWSPALERENPQGNDQQGHVMKLRYTPLQTAVLAVEEEASSDHAWFKERGSLQGTPVLIGELHSMLPALVTLLREWSKSDLSIAYIMTDGAAIPMAWSQHVEQLKLMAWLQGTVTAGQALGGDIEAVNLYTGLLAAKRKWQADVILVMMGPGIVGTGTRYGHSGTEVANIIHAVHALGGLPIAVPRVSLSDSRSRHRGVSHHSLVTLGELTLCPAVVPLASHWIDDEIRGRMKEHDWYSKHWIIELSCNPCAIEQALQAYPSKITTMGRGYTEDPAFFDAVAAAAEFTLRWLTLDEAQKGDESRRCELVKIAARLH
jgi:hypothetical protein